ncbi:MAG: ATP-binding cassette domain-containing protein, partial [Clostridia bacterium]|nr:ATP-binding cassette domain-containing protein [Clostridia bacterium]
MKLIECSNIALQYEARDVVSDLSFSIEQGSFLCIVGENGSGKSTLLKALLGLIKPCDGKITFAKGFSRRQIGYLPQRTEVQQDFPASVEEVVHAGLLNRKKKGFFFKKEEKDIASQVMEQLELTEMRKACFRELSGGQQQRVLLARALTAADGMLLLDEPATGLDPLVTAELY